MKTWTPQAENRLDQYLDERARREGLEGEDATDLKEDLRRHVYEEAEGRPEETVGLMQLETILGGLDAGCRPSVAAERGPSVPPAAAKGSFLVWTLGVVLPALVLCLETMVSFCGSLIFDPIPTWWHVLLVALVPVLNAWLLAGAPGSRGDRWIGAAAGVAIIISGFYALLFLPIIHISLLALIVVGMGILPLTPVMAGFASWRIGRRARLLVDSLPRFKAGRWIGVTAAVLALLALEGPAVWTRMNLQAAAAGKDGGDAVRRLRAFHSERTLLSACYESAGRNSPTDLAGWIATGVEGVDMLFGEGSGGQDSATARDVFFRVTGKPFNSLRPPDTRARGMVGRADPLGEMEFDNDLGGDQVAVRLKNLDLKESRFDGHVDSASEIGYGEWTMVFHNRSRNAQEARCQVRLPAGGHVSRLTLWVNGEPREAAFSTVSKVKAAYKEIAVVQRRDPVLVTAVGPDTVLVQCFPVPAQGEMKIRFGVTAPLQDGGWELPRIVERNFGAVAGLEHALWLQGDSDFTVTGGKSFTAARDGEGRSLSITLPQAVIMDRGLMLKLAARGTGARPAVWCEDKFAKAEERYLIREPRRVKREAAAKVILVVDGSAPMAGWKEAAVAALGENVIAILADDAAVKVDAAALAEYRFTGGRDNEPALREAIRLSREHGGAPIVWLHGPQAAAVSRSERLLQLLERGSVKPVIHAVEAVPGPNRLVEVVYRAGIQTRGPKLSAGDTSLKAYLAELLHGAEEDGWVWRRAAIRDGLEGKEVWDQLARLWAAGAAENTRQPLGEAERSSLAARYQLVTSVSGAVVLETAAQYKQHGLEPVDPDAAPQVPNVPEPSAVMLVLVGTCAAFLRRVRGKAD